LLLSFIEPNVQSKAFSTPASLIAFFEQVAGLKTLKRAGWRR